MKRSSLLMLLGLFAALILLQLSCATTKEDKSGAGPSVSPEQTQAEIVAPAETKETSKSETAPATEKEATQPETATAKAEETSVAAALLADTHKAAGVECSDCHKETPPATETPTEVCMTCHEDYRDVALSAIDPHNAHVEFTRCGDCHHLHKESENQCLSCHSFSLKTP